MKKTLLSLGFCLCLSQIFSQTVITSSYAPPIGRLNIQIKDNAPASSVTEGTSGTNQTWDFTTINNVKKDTMVYIAPSSTPFQSNFPSATHAIKTAAGYNYYQNTASGFLYVGTTTVFDTVVIPINIPILQQETKLKFDSPYLSSYSEKKEYNIQKNVSIDFNGVTIDKIRNHHIDTTSVEYDATGAVTTPFKTFNNCLREKRFEIITDSAFAHIIFQWFPAPGARKDTLLTYSWYTDNYPYPIATIQYKSNKGVMQKISASYVFDTAAVTMPAGPLATLNSIVAQSNNYAVADVQANDILQGNVVTSIVKGPKNGTYTVLDRDSIEYISNQDYIGEDSLTYRITDIYGQYSEAKLFINVEEPLPLVQNDSVAIDMNQFVIANVQGNDYAITALTTTITTLGAPLHGTALILNSDSIKYTPSTNFVGMDSLTYTVCNTNNGCAEGKLVITVNALIPNGIANIKNSVKAVYPNPALNIVNIQTNGNARLFEVYDITGRKMESLNIEGKTSATFNVSEYTKGIYIYKILSNEGSLITGKLSVTK